MHDKRFSRRDCEMDGDVALRCLEDLSVRSGRRRFDTPPIDPDVEMVLRRTGLPQAGPALLVRIMKPTIAEIAHSKMSQVQVCNSPLRRQGFCLFAWHAATKEGEFIAEWPSILRRDLAGVVPPFGAILFMRPMIARECVSIAFRGETKLFCRIGCKHRHHYHQTTRIE